MLNSLLRTWRVLRTPAMGALIVGIALEATAGQAAGPAATGTETSSLQLPVEYVIGPGDILSVVFWRRADVSGDVTVRPDGKISLLLLDDVDAAGFTPEQLRDRILEKASKFFEDARVTVVVKTVNSRNVYITGMISKPGPYPVLTRLTVMQLISLAGGLREFANSDKIAIVRMVNGKETGYYFKYSDIRNLKNLSQNIELKPGDTVIVP